MSLRLHPHPLGRERSPGLSLAATLQSLLTALLLGVGAIAMAQAPEGPIAADPSQGPAPAAADSDAAAVSADAPSAEAADASAAERRRIVQIGMLVIAIVGVAGLALIGLTMVSGGAIRRSLRRPTFEPACPAPPVMDTDASPDELATPPGEHPLLPAEAPHDQSPGLADQAAESGGSSSRPESKPPQEGPPA